MEINKFTKHATVTKAEDDSTAKVKNATPLINNQTQDSFELKSSKTSGHSTNSSVSAQPDIKAEPISNNILEKQLISARLAESGIKSPGSRQANEAGIKTDRENLSDVTKSPIKEAAFGSDIRSKYDGVVSQLGDVFGSSNSSGQSNSNSPADRLSGMPGADQLKKAMTGALTGPQNPEESLNQKFEQHSSRADIGSKKEAAFSEMVNGMTPDASETDHTGAGKEGIKQTGGVGYGRNVGYDDGEGVRGGSGKAGKDNPGLNDLVKQTYIVGGAGSEREYGLLSGEDNFNPNDYKRTDGTRVQTGKDGTVVTTAPDGTKTVTTPDGTKTTVRANGSTTTVKPDGKKEETPPLEDPKKKSGSSSSSETKETETKAADAKDPDQEQYESQEAKKVRQTMQQFDKFLGINTTHSGGLKIQGDIDWDPEATPVSTEPSIVQQMGGPVGLLGQPGMEDKGGGRLKHAANNPMFGGGNVDYEDGSGWQGPEHTQNPEDVDTTIGSDLKPRVQDSNNNDDEEEEENTTTTQTQN